jgi:protocatechuate 3,4-dioxygenase beta subunit
MPTAIARWCTLILLAVGGLVGQRPNEDINTRTVQGIITDSSGAPVAKAVVQLKDTKSLQIRSFITEADGSYHFAGLSPNVEYELKAQHDDAKSDRKKLSIFNSKKVATMNFKLTSKREAR